MPKQRLPGSDAAPGELVTFGLAERELRRLCHNTYGLKFTCITVTEFADAAAIVAGV